MRAARGYPPEPLYACACQDNGWIEVTGEYETEGQRSHVDSPRPKHGLKHTVKDVMRAVRRCQYCNSEREPTEQRKRRDFA